MNCTVCNIEFLSKRADAKYCSPKCRKEASRRASLVTDNVTLKSQNVTDNLMFEFVTEYKPLNDVQDATKAERAKVRKGIYWYDIPLGAIPVMKKGWPKMPSYMNGRQYFLWWKNEFETNDKGDAVILSPYPEYDNVRYAMGGEGSRRWGA